MAVKYKALTYTYLKSRNLSYSSCPAVSHKLILKLCPSTTVCALKLSITEKGLENVLDLMGI